MKLSMVRVCVTGGASGGGGAGGASGGGGAGGASGGGGAGGASGGGGADGPSGVGGASKERMGASRMGRASGGGGASRAAGSMVWVVVLLLQAGLARTQARATCLMVGEVLRHTHGAAGGRLRA